MAHKTITLLEQRDFGQKVNASFDFVKQNFGPLVKSLLFIAGPPALLAGIGQGIVQSKILPGAASTSPLAQLNQFFTLGYAMALLFSIIAYFLSYATVVAFMTLYEEKGSSADIDPATVWTKIGENLSASILAMFLAFLATLVGLIFLIIPAIYLGVALTFFMMGTIREKLSAVDSLQRSRALISGKWWSTFGLFFIMSFITGLISIVFQLPTLITTIMTTLGLAKDISNMDALIIGGSVISIFGSTIVHGLVWVALGFQYYNLVERSEGSSLKSEIEHLGKGDWERPVSEGDF